jgi:hypothetical protein
MQDTVFKADIAFAHGRSTADADRPARIRPAHTLFLATATASISCLIVMGWLAFLHG